MLSVHVQRTFADLWSALDDLEGSSSSEKSLKVTLPFPLRSEIKESSDLLTWWELEFQGEREKSRFLQH